MAQHEPMYSFLTGVLMWVIIEKALGHSRFFDLPLHILFEVFALGADTASRAVFCDYLVDHMAIPMIVALTSGYPISKYLSRFSFSEGNFIVDTDIFHHLEHHI